MPIPIFAFLNRCATKNQAVALPLCPPTFRRVTRSQQAVVEEAKPRVAVAETINFLSGAQTPFVPTNISRWRVQ